MRVIKKPRDKVFQSPGSQFADVHSIQIDEHGHKTLAKTGEKTNIYLKIQAHKDSVDIEKILERCEVEGYEILDRRNVYEGDVTFAPKDMLEAMQQLQEAENNFNSLPLDVRKEFNFSFSEYIAEARNDLSTWAGKMGFNSNTPIEEPEPIPEPIKEGGNE